MYVSYIWLLWLLGCGNAALCVRVCVWHASHRCISHKSSSQSTEKKIMQVRQKKQRKRRKTLFFFHSLPFAILMGFWALIKFKQLARYLCLPTVVAASVNWPQMPLTSQQRKGRGKLKRLLYVEGWLQTKCIIHCWHGCIFRLVSL